MGFKKEKCRGMGGWVRMCSANAVVGDFFLASGFSLFCRQASRDLTLL